MKRDTVIIDKTIGLANCGGSEELYRDTLESLVIYVPKKLEHIKKCLDDNDYTNYIIEAHTLKSNAALIGAEILAAQAKELEYAGKENNYEVLHIKTAQLVVQYEALLTQIKETLEQGKDACKESPEVFGSEEDKEQCCRILEEAQIMLEYGQTEDASDTLELVSIYNVPGMFIEQAEEIIKNLHDGEINQGKRRLNQLIKEAVS
ncbi:MAG: Hpt domain-containing protein [bacterium]|nr:Hpt domain-containing protein [bacterium]